MFHIPADMTVSTNKKLLFTEKGCNVLFGVFQKYYVHMIALLVNGIQNMPTGDVYSLGRT